MLYVAMTFWMLVIVFAAWGIHTIWSSLIKPRVVNSVLLPGTLVAQLGHVLGLLVTGGTVQNTTLMADDEEGQPQTAEPEETRVPVIGPVLVGLLPLVACGACLYLAARWWGRVVVASYASKFGLPQRLPTTLDGVWDLLRALVTSAEAVLGAIVGSNLLHWPTLLFLYLAVCLTVRMGPLHGNYRGAIGAIVLAGGLIGLLGTLLQPARELVQSSWPVLSFATGMLLLLLIISLVVRGVVAMIRILAGSQKGSPARSARASR